MNVLGHNEEIYLAIKQTDFLLVELDAIQLNVIQTKFMICILDTTPK